ncbi:MAG TPA: N-acetyltransferase [Acinetobacter ursingii]|uniref:GNAT family N-acetyltransferase n=1 Tax=Acinetobacter ursingii TaxID=108980 RepID=UPI0006694FEF|nr:N-acetyltransferase [Acinetobacter ursingii]MCH2005391.1 N-acetyltransferase [Acinetobacter ursingii]MCH2015124.1 N-acetyltransferase [Acinetobacter ursingii]HCO08916.1 N-acetyltransferase [Acinetobacter ursingii]
MSIEIRHEQQQDIQTIEALTQAAFLNEQHSSHTEQFIVNQLRKDGQLTISLVALEQGAVVGHVAVSPVRISSGETDWYGLGPISVWPEQQGQGIGSQLMNATLEQLKQLGANGCVLLGDPAYYHRFGFKTYPELILPDVPPKYFQAISFVNTIPKASVSYHEAFNATSS